MQHATLVSIATLVVMLTGCEEPSGRDKALATRAPTLTVAPETFYPGQTIRVEGGFTPQFIPTAFPCNDPNSEKRLVAANPRFALQIIRLRETEAGLSRDATLADQGRAASGAGTWVDLVHDLTVPDLGFSDAARANAVIRVESAMNYTGCSDGGNAGAAIPVTTPYAGRGYRLTCPAERGETPGATRCAYKYDPELGDGFPKQS